MKLISKIGFTFYWVLALANAFLIYSNIVSLKYVTQTLLIPILFLTIVSQIHPNRYKSLKLLFTLAFLFCLVGDILMIKNYSLMNGLILYSIAQIIYSIFFLKHKGIVPLSFIIMIVIGGTLAGITALLYSDYPNIFYTYFSKILIIIIPLSLLIFTTLNLLFCKQSKELALKYFIPGTLVWAFSYLLIFLDLFLFNESNFNTFTYLLYASAQFYYGKGIIEEMKYEGRSHKKKRKRKSKTGENEIGNPAINAAI